MLTGKLPVKKDNRLDKEVDKQLLNNALGAVAKIKNRWWLYEKELA